MFNSGGGGARPTLDGLSATAFPSGVMTMPVEATEQVGPVIVWRKELRPDSGGAGQHDRPAAVEIAEPAERQQPQRKGQREGEGNERQRSRRRREVA